MNHRDLQPLQAPPPITERPDLGAVKRMRMEMGSTPVEFAAEHLEEARPELIQAMKCLDTSEHRDLHLRLGNLVIALDDLRALLAERSQS